MKKIFLMLSFSLMVSVAMSIPAKKGLKQTITLADGREVQVELVGDEYGHWLRAADGTCYVRTNDVYTVAEASALETRRNARMSRSSVVRRAIYASTSDGLGAYGVMSCGAVPSIGEYTIPVVMVQFSDTKFKTTTTVEKMQRYYNEEGYSEDGSIGSVRDYFMSQSGGMFIPTFDVVGIVTLSKTSAYYGQNDSWGYDMHVDDLPADVIQAAIEQLDADFSQYVVEAGDEKHSAGVPLLCMLYAGKGEATEDETSANSKLLWPCEWDDMDDIANGDYQGVHFNSFFIGNELNTGGQELMGLSVFCHEFGHALGLPDFYCTDYNYSRDDAFGLWSIMDVGAYVDEECRKPIGYNAYEKSYMGWLDLKEMGDAEEVTLESPSGTGENSAYILRHSDTETFIFENRQPGTWYPTAFGSGVLVSRIAYDKTSWSNNIVNNVKSKKRACVLTADGRKLYNSASPTNLYGNNKNKIPTLQTFSGSQKHIGIGQIVKNDDGTITLTFESDTPLPEGLLFYESFDQCEGKGGNDDLWNGAIALGAFMPDNEGWEAPKGYGANQCARFGSSDIIGSALTPAFTIGGSAVLSFKAGAWDAAKDGTELSLMVTDGCTVQPASFTMEKGAFKDFTATIEGNGSVQIHFLADNGRFLLDEVKVESVAADIVTLTTDSPVDRVYTVEGRYMGTNLKALGPGLYIVNGRKVVK